MQICIYWKKIKLMNYKSLHYRDRHAKFHCWYNLPDHGVCVCERKDNRVKTFCIHIQCKQIQSICVFRKLNTNRKDIVYLLCSPRKDALPCHRPNTTNVTYRKTHLNFQDSLSATEGSVCLAHSIYSLAAIRSKQKWCVLFVSRIKNHWTMLSF